MNLLKTYLTIAIAALALASCDDNLETMSDTGGLTSNPSPVSSISAEALPGQIVLHWTVPADSNYYLLKVKYYDHLSGKEVFRVASVYQDSLLIDNTRQKFGDYDFTFQTFNAANVGGEVQQFSAVSGPATITETITTSTIALTASQLSTNNQEPSEGPIANLIDGNNGSFFHTRWSSPQIPMPQYIQINLNQPIDDFQFWLKNRSGSQQAPKIVEIQISNDGATWETIETISSGLPSAGGAEYTSAIFRPGHSFTYFRYNCLETYDKRNYFNLAEFRLYDVDIQVYNPEL
ncbi:MAG: discoidin domain-containing protein [Mangrovibacterium sp.]